jgi:hypothetical protein
VVGWEQSVGKGGGREAGTVCSSAVPSACLPAELRLAPSASDSLPIIRPTVGRKPSPRVGPPNRPTRGAPNSPRLSSAPLLTPNLHHRTVVWLGSRPR